MKKGEINDGWGYIHFLHPVFGLKVNFMCLSDVVNPKRASVIDESIFIRGFKATYYVK